MEIRIINHTLLHILLLISCALSIQCEAKSSVIKKHFDVISPDSYSVSVQSPSAPLPPYCVYPPLTPFPPALPLPSPPPPPPPPPQFLYYSPPAVRLAPPPPPPFYVPSPPELQPGPPVFLPPVVYPPPAERTLPGLWCVANPTVPDPIIQEAMDYACGAGADCDSIQPNGRCYQPDTLLAHASYAFNSCWQRTKVVGGTCDFGGTAMLITVDPSYGGCRFNLL